MTRMVFSPNRRHAMLLAVVALAISSPFGICPRQALAGHPVESAPVPPSKEIVVVDPGVDAEGKPKVLLSADGSRRIEIPPTVLVHRFYYTGDRSFQAQLLPGGPCILAVNSPKDGQRRYIEAMLPPGAPRVIYRSDSITYNFTQQVVTLKFDHHGFPHVIYQQGKPVLTKVSEKTRQTLGAPRRLFQRSGIGEGAKEVTKGTGEVVTALHDGVKEASKVATLPTTRIIDSLPFVNAIRDSKQFRSDRSRVDNLEKAAQTKLDSEATVRTNQ